jgi:hypothetical protein
VYCALSVVAASLEAATLLEALLEQPTRARATATETAATEIIFFILHVPPYQGQKSFACAATGWRQHML